MMFNDHQRLSSKLELDLNTRTITLQFQEEKSSKESIRINQKQKKMRKETLKNKYLRSINSRADAPRTCMSPENGLQKAVKNVFTRKNRFKNRQATDFVTDFLTDFRKFGVADQL